MADSRRAAFNQFRYIPVVACVLLVVLRLSIGWQFLYEGLWKYDTLDTTQPWTAEGYLKNAQGPFRELFREGMTDDPDELGWLNEEAVAARWDAWQTQFANHYGLDDDQRARLDTMVNGPQEFRAVLTAMPEGVEIPGRLRDILRFDARAERLILKGDTPLMPAEKESLLALAVEPAEVTDANRAEAALVDEFRSAVIRLAELSERFSYKQKLRLALGPGDPDRVRHMFANFKGTIGEKAPEEIDDYYQSLLKDYQAKLERADVAFQREHLDRQWSKIQELRNELTGPVKALDTALKSDARTLLTREQIERGPLPKPWTTQRVVDAMTIAALMVLGLMLLVGLGTRAAAIMGAGMVLSFYLVWPPWPGVPLDPTPEHAYIVNKNFIEMVALLALAALPTGQWFGLDRLIYRGWLALRGRRSSPPKTSTTSEPTVATSTG